MRLRMEQREEHWFMAVFFLSHGFLIRKIQISLSHSNHSSILSSVLSKIVCETNEKSSALLQVWPQNWKPIWHSILIVEWNTWQYHFKNEYLKCMLMIDLLLLFLLKAWHAHFSNGFRIRRKWAAILEK